LRRHAESSPSHEQRRRHVNHRQQSSRPKRAQKAGICLGRLGHVVVDAAHDDRIAASGRQSGVALLRLNDRDVAKVGSVEH
jgi:hypothetical protein